MKTYSKVFCAFVYEGETVNIGVVTSKEVTDFIKSCHGSRLWREATGCSDVIARPLIAVEFREFGDPGTLHALTGSTHHVESVTYEPTQLRRPAIKAYGLHTA